VQCTTHKLHFRLKAVWSLENPLQKGGNFGNESHRNKELERSLNRQLVN
jgi:hypothetical protein